MERPTALVTGASSGIGAATAAHLARLGFTVLAGVRRHEDEDAVRATRVVPLNLDITDPEAVSGAVRVVDRIAGGRLAGLVNNAGIAVVGPVEALTLADWRRQLEVNLLGHIAVTTALLPALLRARGRVINISSLCGRLALPLLGPYSASKSGLDAFTDTLRREVGMYGVTVVSVHPGAVATSIWDKSRSDGEARRHTVPPVVWHRYAGAIRVTRRWTASAARGGRSSDSVAAVVGRALTVGRPRTRYVVGGTARLQLAFTRVLPDRLTDLIIARWLRAIDQVGHRA
jgi:NAD(P)-dependent dehydrogenase (short-subunit alcohol dehydrogenase family)